MAWGLGGGRGLRHWAYVLSWEQGIPQGGDNKEIICLPLLSPHHLNQTHYPGKCLEIPLPPHQRWMTLSPNLDGLRHISETHLFCFSSQHTTNPQATKAGSNENRKKDKQKTRKTGTDKGVGAVLWANGITKGLHFACWSPRWEHHTQRDQWTFRNIRPWHLNSPLRRATGTGMWFSELPKVKVNLFHVCNKLNQGNKVLPKKDHYSIT